MCIEMLIKAINFMLENVSLSLMIALVTALWALYQHWQNRKENNSKFYLEKYIEASNYILKSIESDKPTRRMAWVSAERIAEKLYVLKDKVTEKPDKEFLNIYLRSFAHELNFYFLKPWSYFCWTENVADLKEALKGSGHGQANIYVNSIPKSSEIKFIDESSIKSIFDLTKGTWESESGYTYKNDTEFLNVMKTNYPQLGAFIEQRRNFLKNINERVGKMSELKE